MMKIFRSHVSSYICLSILFLSVVVSCEESEPEEPMLPDFAFSIDEAKPNYVTLTNTSQGDYDRISWTYNKSDKKGEKINEIEIYLPLAGTYDVVLHLYKGDVETTVTKQVKITQDALIADFNYSIDADEPNNVTLINTTQGDYDRISWTYNQVDTTGVNIDQIDIYLPKAGSYDVVLNVYKGDVVSTVTKQVIIAEDAPVALVADFNYSIVADKPNYVTLTNASEGDYDRISWTYNSEEISGDNIDQVEIYLPKAGTYDVVLHVYKGDMETTVTKQVSIAQDASDLALIPDFNYIIDADRPNYVTLINTSQGDYDRISWTYNQTDTTGVNIDQIEIYLPKAGTYNVVLHVYKGDEETTVTKQVIIAQDALDKSLVADFTFSIDTDRPNYVALTNTTQGDYDRISWTYNSEEISGDNIHQVEIYLPKAGTYDVVLHVYKGDLNTAVTKQVSIEEDAPDESLVADFTYSIDVAKPNYVTLINTTQGDYDRISWTYNGEEISGDEIDQVEIYLPKAGTYDVVLHVYKGNAEITATKQVSIAEDAPDESLVADFTYSIVAANPNYVTLTNTTEGDYDRISWTYNGEEISGDNIDQVEIYLPKAGTYDVVLHVYKGDSEVTATKQVSIAADAPDESLVADFTYSIDAAKPNYVTLTNTTQGDYDRISWTYNGEEISGDNIEQVEIFLPKAGTYDVVLYVYKDVSETTVTKQVNIAEDAPEEPKDWTLVWSDEFNGSSVNRDDWNFETGASGWGNEELQNYTDGDNAEVSSGTLKIIARKVNDDKVAGSYTSSRITSKRNFLYGRMEARVKVPTGNGVWPAFWMLGTNIYTAGHPACGEIDILEYVGNEPDFVHASVHATATAGSSSNSKTVELETAEEEFHIYGIIWTEESIAFYIDDPANVFLSYSPENKNDDNWPFDKNQFFILNQAVGGTWGGYKGIDNSIFPQTFEIDYVRVYQ